MGFLSGNEKKKKRNKIHLARMFFVDIKYQEEKEKIQKFGDDILYSHFVRRKKIKS